jgi:hypothetical protein
MYSDSFASFVVSLYFVLWRLTSLGQPGDRLRCFRFVSSPSPPCLARHSLFPPLCVRCVVNVSTACIATLYLHSVHSLSESHVSPCSLRRTRVCCVIKPHLRPSYTRHLVVHTPYRPHLESTVRLSYNCVVYLPPRLPVCVLCVVGVVGCGRLNRSSHRGHV